MGRMALIFAITLAMVFCSMWARANQAGDMNLGNLIGPPMIIDNHKGKGPHAVFDLGGVEYLFKLTQLAKPYPQCDAIQVIREEIMVVGINPKGYVYFVDATPVAFKTGHSPIWGDLIRKTFNQKNKKVY